MKETAIKLILTIVIMACLLLPIPAVAMLCLGSASAMWTDDRSCESSNPQIILLKSYTPTEELNEISPDFYTHFGFRGWWRFPLVYPYGIHAVETLDEGILKDERQVVDYEKAWQESDSILSNIQSFTFDRNYLLAVTDQNFVLFNFDTQEINLFNTMQELTNEAESLNFAGNMKFVTLREYDDLFTCSK
jgi:hypothetical protein